MDADRILQIMAHYLTSSRPEENPSDLASRSVSNVLTSSFEVIEFVMHLEEELGLDEDIDLDALGPKFAQNITFAELAQEIVAHLENKKE